MSSILGVQWDQKWHGSGVGQSRATLKYLHSTLKCKSEANGFHGIVTLTKTAAELEATASYALEGYFVFPPCHHAIIVQQASRPRDIYK